MAYSLKLTDMCSLWNFNSWIYYKNVVFFYQYFINYVQVLYIDQCINLYLRRECTDEEISLRQQLNISNNTTQWKIRITWWQPSTLRYFIVTQKLVFWISSERINNYHKKWGNIIVERMVKYYTLLPQMAWIIIQKAKEFNISDVIYNT